MGTAGKLPKIQKTMSPLSKVCQDKFSDKRVQLPGILGDGIKTTKCFPDKDEKMLASWKKSDYKK